MKMNTYLAGLLVQARDTLTGEAADKILAGLMAMGVHAPPAHPDEVNRTIDALAEKLGKGGRKKALALVVESGRMAREQHTAICRGLYALTALERHLRDEVGDRIVTPWEQELVSGTGSLPEMLRAQNEILVEPAKKKKGEGEGEMDAGPRSGVLARLYVDALGFDSLPKLCVALGLDRANPDDVLALDVALEGVASEYSLAQRRSEQVAKQAKRHAEEFESQHYAIIAGARPIHEQAEAIRSARRNSTIPGIPMDPPPKSDVPPPMPTAEEVAASLFDLMQRRAREAAESKEGLVIDAQPEPPALSDGKRSWSELNLYDDRSGIQAGKVVRSLLLGFYRDGAEQELIGWQFVPHGLDSDGRCTTAEGEQVSIRDAAYIDGRVVRLPGRDQINWSGYTEPLLRSAAVRRDGRDQMRAIDSHRVLTAEEIGTIDGGYPPEKIRQVFWEEQRTLYTVDYEEHHDHLAKQGRDEAAEPEPKGKPAKPKKGKR